MVVSVKDKKTIAAKSTTTKKTVVKKTVAVEAKTKPAVTAGAKAPAKKATAKKTDEPKIGTVLEATEEQVLIAQSIANLQTEINESGILEKMEQISQLKTELVGAFHGGDTQDLTITLDDGTVIKISKPSTKSTVDKDKVLKFMGKENFLKLATVGVTDAKKYLTPEQQQEAITIASGSRSVSLKLADNEE
ncbi:MAG: hypothetical protein RR280_04275 [Bacteroidaceae bacterium]